MNLTSHSVKIALTLLACPVICLAQDNRSKELSPPQASSLIEVAFVLDTTGSMSGLIEGAKQKIWYLANQMATAKPTPQIRIGLVGYRDRGDDYVTKIFDLDEDLDRVYMNLKSFGAAGGGDAPESVNQALDEAVRKLSWSSDRRALKVMYLVGDQPPHMDYENEARYPEILQAAVKRDLIVNTIQCGNAGETAPIWQEIARRGEGKYAAIGQTGGMQVIASPFDGRVAALNAEIDKTVVSYGSAARRENVVAKIAAAEAAPAAVRADRMKLNMINGKVVQGEGDLLHDLKSGRVELQEIRGEELPAELRGLRPEEQKKYIEDRASKREALQVELGKLLKERDDYVAAEQKRLAASGKAAGFDAQVIEALREQAKRKGIVLE